MGELKRRKGPAIAALGGGHGLSAILRGLKLYTDDLTAIVTVADDGGGSGVLREDLGMPPPGDIRSCMEALADTESLMRQLLAYRFPDGRLAGQAFGNLLLAALDGISPSFDQAVARMSEVLAITGRILPVTNANVQLEARFENGPASGASPRSPPPRRSRTAASTTSASCRSTPLPSPRRWRPSGGRR